MVERGGLVDWLLHGDLRENLKENIRQTEHSFIEGATAGFYPDMPEHLRGSEVSAGIGEGVGAMLPIAKGAKLLQRYMVSKGAKNVGATTLLGEIASDTAYTAVQNDWTPEQKLLAATIGVGAPVAVRGVDKLMDSKILRDEGGYILWHGSAKPPEGLVGGKFSSKFIGSGEGGAMIGHGLNTSQIVDVARGYAKQYGVPVHTGVKPSVIKGLRDLDNPSITTALDAGDSSRVVRSLMSEDVKGTKLLIRSEEGSIRALQKGIDEWTDTLNNKAIGELRRDNYLKRIRNSTSQMQVLKDSIARRKVKIEQAEELRQQIPESWTTKKPDSLYAINFPVGVSDAEAMKNMIDLEGRPSEHLLGKIKQGIDGIKETPRWGVRFKQRENIYNSRTFESPEAAEAFVKKLQKNNEIYGTGDFDDAVISQLSKEEVAQYRSGLIKDLEGIVERYSKSRKWGPGAALEKDGLALPYASTGKSLYNDLEAAFGSGRIAARWLRDQGIYGTTTGSALRFRRATKSGLSPQGEWNFVSFRPETDVEILFNVDPNLPRSPSKWRRTDVSTPFAHQEGSRAGAQLRVENAATQTMFDARQQFNGQISRVTTSPDQSYIPVMFNKKAGKWEQQGEVISGIANEFKVNKNRMLLTVDPNQEYNMDVLIKSLPHPEKVQQFDFVDYIKGRYR